MENTDDSDGVLGDPVVDDMLLYRFRMAAREEIGALRSEPRILGRTSERAIERGGVGVPLSQSPRFAGVLEDIPDIGPGFACELESMA